MENKGSLKFRSSDKEDTQIDDRRAPFIQWLARLHAAKSITRSGKDFILDFAAGLKFAIGITEKSQPVLGVRKHLVRAMTAAPWRGAALLKNHKGKDWIVLSCPDIRVDDSSGDAVPIRIWIPIMSGSLDKIFSLDELKKANTALLVHTINIKDGKAEPDGQSPIMRLPLTIKS